MSSKSIYSFKPKYLYIKRHGITGKLYFGTTTKDPEKYKGSGHRWLKHIAKHGTSHVETLWYCLFLDQKSLTDFALNFSEQNDIVNSDEWLNLKPENGLDGSPAGIVFSEEHRNNMSKARKGIKLSDETRAKMSKPKSHEHSKNISKGKQKALRISGITFDSGREAAAYFGVYPPIVSKWIKLGIAKSVLPTNR